jgi:hypothetical protein
MLSPKSTVGGTVATSSGAGATASTDLEGLALARADPASALRIARVNPNQATREYTVVERLEEIVLNRLGIAKNNFIPQLGAGKHRLRSFGIGLDAARFNGCLIRMSKQKFRNGAL